MDATPVVDPFKSDCPTCQSKGPLILEGFTATSHEGKCFRQIRTREKGRLVTSNRLLFNIVEFEGKVQANLYDPGKDDLGFIISAFGRSFLSYQGHQALERAVCSLPAKDLHRFFRSKHKERWKLFDLLDRGEIEPLYEYYTRVTKYPITSHKSCDDSTLEKHSHQVNRFALFIFYFQKDLSRRIGGRYYIGQASPLPIDIYTFSSENTVVIYHLKNTQVIGGKTHYFGTKVLGTGSEHKVRLSLRFNFISRKIDFCATATPNFPALNKAIGIGEDWSRDEWIDRFSNNVQRWSYLSSLSTHIVQPYYVKHYRNKEGKRKANVVMEYGEEQLESRILEERCQPNDYINLLDGLRTLHYHGYFSLDIKHENIVGVHGQLKYIDVSSAISKTNITDDHVYTARSRAPEMFIDSNPLSSAIDVFALGIVLYTMRYGDEPSFCEAFDSDESEEEMVAAFLSFHESFCPTKKSPLDWVIKQMLNGNPKERISADKAWKFLSNKKRKRDL